MEDEFVHATIGRDPEMPIGGSSRLPGNACRKTIGLLDRVPVSVADPAHEAAAEHVEP